MALQLLPLEEKDASIFYRVVEVADQQGPFARNFWLNGVTEEGRAHSARNAIADMAEPGGPDRFLKVVDLALPDDDPMNKILSVAQWKIYPKARTPEDVQAAEEKEKSRGIPPGANPAFLEDVLSMFGKEKDNIIGTQPHAHLQMLFTRPEGFRRGGGGMLVAWGCEQADKYGIPAYLEASQMGKPLYQRHGFQPLKEIGLDRAKWNLGTEDVVTCMLRPARTKTASVA